ncbi:MBL fold metallo-hydrolase [Litchfieldia salsa]|uniref:Glyoxylase, beta-lactamase superfamily II n=1 Tax=Litchfieldia salsa TaxID=930152 RepID=A0A1H0RTK3_9BACI|nr:MBL fold metallo-hydrolase [Litchfieldia salsa]SDP32725.1 Glyoxylase, beta-lactamase superfamily II [Litchfieldia salsa]
MDKEMEYGKDYKFIPVTSIASGLGQLVAPDVYCYTNQVVNMCVVGTTDHFVLIDAGMPRSSDDILSMVEEQYGNGSRPKAIILTHGHFDHIGGIIELVNKWEVPVYAHELELPYLRGEKSYPLPDSTVEGGMVAKMSPMFPNEPIDLTNHVNPLPPNGSVPEMPEWRWIHTPGHSPGHVSFFREEDRTLIVGDAFVTVKQDELYKVFTQQKEINGPPRYLTTDWQAAWDSVRELEKLKPLVAVTGHGAPMSGKELEDGLKRLGNQFETIAIPDYGQYINKNNLH